MVAYDFKVPGGEWRSTHGDLSAEGASFITSSSIIAKLIIMKIRVPAYADEIVATAVVVSQRQLEDGSSKLGLAFIDVEVDAQLAIAEWVDFKARANA